MNNKRNGSSGRQIDEAVSRTTRKVRTGFTAVPSMKIKTWKASLILLFVVGFFSAMVWGAYNKWYVGSQAADMAGDLGAKHPVLALTLTANPKSGSVPLTGVKFNTAVIGKMVDSGKVWWVNYFFYCEAPDATNELPNWPGIPANFDRKYYNAPTSWSIKTNPDGREICDGYYTKKGQHWPTVYAITYPSGDILNKSILVKVTK